MIETFVAATVLAACVGLMLRLCLGQERRRELDVFFKRMATSPLYVSRKIRASRSAAQVIRRAKEGGDWEGNVYTPKAFKRSRKSH